MKKLKYIVIALFLLLFPFGVFAKENDKITLYFFHGDGCPHCAEEEEYLKSIKNKYPKLKIKKYEVWYDDDNSELLKKVYEALNVERNGVPTNVIGDTVIMGFGDTTGSKIERAIEYYQENDYEDVVSQIKKGTYDKKKDKNEFEKEEEQSDEDMTVTAPLVGKVNLKKVSLMTASVLIGLIDGFNPCAMWVLLFLISILVGMKDRKRMWILGLAFLSTSALLYLFIMLSWITVAVKITSIIWVRNVIAVVAIIGGIINLRSFINSNDSGCEVVDDKKRKSIIKKIKKFTSEKSFILALLGVIGLAVSVNLVELACSAGLPIVFSELLVINKVDSFMKFMYTLVYILFFLIDDLIIFFIAMFTMKVTGISTKYNKYSHLLGGIIMLLIGLLLIFNPKILMFNFK